MTWSIASIAPVLLGVASAQAALGLSTPLIPLLLVQVGASAGAIGLVSSSYFVGFLCAALTADRFVRRLGHTRCFAVMAAVAADAALLTTFAPGAWAVAASRFLVGYASSGMFLVAESWLNDRADRANRGRIFSAYLVVSWGASAAGPLLLSVVPPSPLLFVCVGIAFATAVVPMVLTMQPNPPVTAQVRMGPLALFRISPVGVACAFTAGLVNSAFYAMAPVYLTGIGVGTPAVATFSTAALVAGLAVQVPVGWASDRFGRRPVTLAAVVVAFASALVLMAATRQGFFGVAVTGCVYAGATAALYGLGAGQTNDRMRRGDHVAASGGLLFTWSLGSSISPFLAGLVMGALGPGGLFIYLASTLGGLALFVAVRMAQRGEVPRDERTVFVPAPSAPARHSELATRAMWALTHPLASAKRWRGPKELPQHAPAPRTPDNPAAGAD